MSTSRLVPPAAAPAPVLALRWVGANVGMGEILPAGFDYVTTDQGDLFDIAHKAGFTVFRVIDWMPQLSYSAANWTQIRDRASATGIALIPVLAQTTGDTTNAAAEAPFVSQCEQKAAMILGGAGLATSPALAFVDIVNEPMMTGWAGDALAKITAYIHAQYPGVAVTVGGWEPLLENGNALPAGLDVVAPHLYTWQGVDFNDSPASAETPEVLTELGTIAAFSGPKPIVVEEFGTASGLLAFSDGSNRLAGSPDSQAAHTAALFAGIAQARAAGIAVDGAIFWNFYPGYGQSGWFEEPNANALIVPQGPGLHVNVMPAVEQLCKATGGSCAGAQELVDTPPLQK